MKMPLGNAYQAALSAPAQPPQAEPMPVPAEAAVMPRTPQNVNPMTQNGDVFFIDPAMLPSGKCEVGQDILLKATIQSKGSKIGLTPVEVVMEGEEDDDNEMDEQ